MGSSGGEKQSGADASPSAPTKHQVKKEGIDARSDESASESEHDHNDTSAPAVPMQKRRRVTRACDECRRKKIKCDGKQPCTHCTVYSYECTYDQPSNRRRNAPPQYVESLEQQLKRANAILQVLIPNIDLSDPNLETRLHQMQLSPPPLQPLESASQSFSSLPEPKEVAEGQLESMVKATGDLDLDEQGNFEYHGHSSGLHFMRRMRESLGSVMGPEPKNTPFMKTRPMSIVVDSPRSASDSPMDPHTAFDLPPCALARELCDIAINDAGALLRIVHYPTFLRSMERLYDIPPDQYGNDENVFLPLFYAVLALATLFANPGPDGQEQGYEVAISEGFKYFKQSRHLMDIADCRDLRQLQALVFMILFLQSSAKLSVCYAYIGVALRSALRMGLHRSFTKNFNPIEAETRKRVFWVIRKLDIYVGALLGLPHSLNDDEIDQELPTEVDDEYITESAILPMPEGKISLMTAANAHTGIVEILTKIVKHIYPPEASTRRTRGKNTYSVSYTSIVEIERDLQNWSDALPQAMKPGGEATKTMQRCQHMLRLAYAHAQMMLYRPFLHYVSQTRKVTEVDKRSYACAAACVSVARNVVNIAVEMKKRGLLQGAYWFSMYTTFFAILSLVFYAFENPHSESSQEVLKAATEAKDALAALAKRSLAADRCATTLKTLFEQLPKHPVSRKTVVSRKRRQASPPAPATTRSDTSFDTVPMQNAAFSQPLSQQYQTGMQYATANGFYDVESGLSSTPDSMNMSYSPTQPMFSDSPGYADNFPLADLSAMMFPNPDPLAYPTQPSDTGMTCESLFGIMPSDSTINPFTSNDISQNVTNTSDFIPPSTFMYQASNDQNSCSQAEDVALLGPMPMYMMQGDAQLPLNFANPSTSTPTRSTFTFSTTASPLPTGIAYSSPASDQSRRTQHTLPRAHNNVPTASSRPQQQQQQQPYNIQLDALLGNEEWKGLPRDRIPGTGALFDAQMGGASVASGATTVAQQTGPQQQQVQGQNSAVAAGEMRAFGADPAGFDADLLGWNEAAF